jgi:ATP-binding cassette, subfamily B, bacterial PglK
MEFWRVLTTLWRILERQRRFIFVGLVALLFVSGVLETIGMLVIFGFIRGLSVDAQGHRHGAIGAGLQRLLGHTLSDLEFSLLGGGTVLGVILIKNAHSLFVRFHVTRFLGNLTQRISMQLFNALMTTPYERMLESGAKRPRETLSTTIDVFGVCFRSVVLILADSAMLVMVITLLLFVDPRLTLVAAVMFGGLGFAIYRVLQGSMRWRGKLERRALRVVDRELSDAFGGVVQARLQDQVKHFASRYGRGMGVVSRAKRQRDVVRRIPASANELLLTTGVTGAVAYLVLSGNELTDAIPTLAIFGFAGLRANGAMSRTNGSFQRLRQQSERFEKYLAIAERLAPKIMGSDDVETETYLVDEEPLPPGRDGHLTHELTLSEVSFKYPDGNVNVVEDVSLVVQRGQFVSFCGESGSGKSTILMLMIGLLRPTRGEVACDGWNIHRHIRAWHRNIGYVQQGGYIVRDSVRRNVAFGIDDEKIDDAKVWKALELAAAREFVEALPDGLETQLRGHNGRLSGGQRQRLVIARALYHDPDIVVFDEATAALDNITEQVITEAAIRLSGNKTVLCVAHRLSTIRQSDAIHLVHEGRIVGSGTYEELLRGNERFQRLARVEA